MDLIFLALCAVICDANSWADVEEFGHSKLQWLRKYIRLNNGVPSHDTIGRVFSRLDSIEFQTALQNWSRSLTRNLQGESVALDGKTLRGSFDKASESSPLHVVTAWACGLKLCLGMESVEEKSNEIPAVQNLIDMLDLQGSVVTADAMHCQRETAAQIIDKEADYILIAKDNQPSLVAAIQETFTKEQEKAKSKQKIRRHTTQERNRGREEVRDVIVMQCPSDHPVFSLWKGIQTIGVIYRERGILGKLAYESEFFISSLPPKVKGYNDRLRMHWGIENSQHHILDVTFTEDASRIRKGTSPEISAALRRVALNILQQDTTMKGSIRGKRKKCGWSEEIFDSLLAQI